MKSQLSGTGSLADLKPRLSSISYCTIVNKTQSQVIYSSISKNKDNDPILVGHRWWLEGLFVDKMEHIAAHEIWQLIFS